MTAAGTRALWADLGWPRGRFRAEWGGVDNDDYVHRLHHARSGGGGTGGGRGEVRVEATAAPRSSAPVEAGIGDSPSPPGSPREGGEVKDELVSVVVTLPEDYSNMDRYWVSARRPW